MAKRGRSSWKRQADEFKAGLGGLDERFAEESRRREDLAAERYERNREKACTSKNRYDSEAEAEEVIDECWRHGRRNLKSYRCPYCDGWHLTSHAK